MVHDQYDTFTLEASFAPGERWNAYAFYSYEDGDILQNGRQSGSTLELQPRGRVDLEHRQQGEHLRRRPGLHAGPREVVPGPGGPLPEGRRQQRRDPAARLQHVDLLHVRLRPVRGDPGTLRHPRLRRHALLHGPGHAALPVRQALERGRRGRLRGATRSTTPRPATPSTTCPRPSSCRPTTGTTRPGWAT